MKRIFLKKTFFLALLASVLLSLSVSAAMLPPSPTAADCPPGCDCSSGGIWDIQKHHSEALRVRDKAYDRQIIKRNDSTLGLTCFDQAMMLTSRLGAIFSDNTPTPPVPADTEAFQAEIAYPDWGRTERLPLDLDQVVMPVIDVALNQFTDSLMGNFGSGGGGSGGSGGSGEPSWDDWIQMIMQLLQGVTSGAGGSSDLMAQIQQMLQMITQMMNSLGTASPSQVPGQIDVLNGLQQQLTDLTGQLQNQLGGALSGPLGDVTNTIMSSAMDMSCKRIEQLWNDQSAGTGTRSVEGNGIEMGTPYMDMFTFLNGATGAGQDFIGEITTSVNQPILQAALNDLTNLLSGPGQLNSWPSVPTFSPDATTQQIINAMGNAGAP